MLIESPDPSEFKIRILLVVIGKTPQIVTETLYKLVVDSSPAFVPTELHIITTREGASSAQLALLGVKGQIGWFHQFCYDYHCSSIAFDTSQIHIIKDTEGQFLDDNESIEHNRIASDFITHKIKEFCALEESALHVSLAGGRKTMSFYAGYALSLYGRAQDRLSHILVNEPFQNNKDFFYPRPKPERLAINNEYFSTDDAHVILSEIPFVRMGCMIDTTVLIGDTGFKDSVEKIQRLLQPPCIEIDREAQSVCLNGFEISMQTSEFAFYYWLCRRKKNACSPLTLNDEFMSEYVGIYSEFLDKMSDRLEVAESLQQNKNAQEQKEWFGMKRSKIKNLINTTLGQRPGEIFLVQNHKVSKLETVYEITVDAEAILIK